MLRIKLFLLMILLLPKSGQANNIISLIVDDVPVNQVLQVLAEQQKLNLLISPDVKGTMSLHLLNVPGALAFSQVLKSAKLNQQREGNIVRIVPEAILRQQVTEREAQRKILALNQPLYQQVFTPHYADADELVKVLKNSGTALLSPKGSVSVDKRTNRLIVLDTKAALKMIMRWMKEMDIPLGQVEIAAHIVTVNQEKLRELGVKWSLPAMQGANRATGIGNVAADFSIAANAARAGFNIARINGRLLEVELSALERQNQLEIIASPRLMTEHQQPASIKQGTEIPYQVSSGESGATSIEFKEAVLGMEVTPTIQPGGDIRLKLRISQNMPGRSIRQGEGEALAIDKQEIETVVAVKHGETLALGGIFQQHSKADTEGIPGLKKLPLLGGLFRHDAKDRQRRELIVFITPRLIKSL